VRKFIRQEWHFSLPPFATIEVEIKIKPGSTAGLSHLNLEEQKDLTRSTGSGLFF
jgi:hypothetical protein